MKTSMFTKFARNAVAIAALAGATVTVNGCAVETEASSTSNEAPAGPAMGSPVALSLDPEAILEDMAKALAGAASKEIEKKLFPQDTLDVNKLLADVDANTRQAIIDEAMRKDHALLDASTIFLKRIEREKATMGTGTTKTGEQLYDEVNSNTVLANVDVVIAGVAGESVKIQFKREGLRLFVMANQINANRYMLQMQLRPRTADSDKTALLEMLRGGSTYVKTIVNDYRAEEIERRVGQITDCATSQEWDYTAMKTLYVAKFRDVGQDRTYGEQSSYDEATAIGKCDYWRDGHIRSLERTRTDQMNADSKFTFALKMADEWSKAADKLEGKTAAQSTVTKGLDFGGMWGYVSVNGKTVASNNPFTGAPSCPPGYNDDLVVGKVNVDWPLHQCTRPANGVAEPVADFGGMYGNMDYREQRYTSLNPITSQANCPAGFTATKVLGDNGSDNDLYMCAKAHVPGTKAAYGFGGAFSRKAGYATPDTKVGACATGFVPVQVWGSNGTHGHKRDEALNICTLP